LKVLKSFHTSPGGRINATLKDFCNAEDLNRIEINSKNLSDIFNLNLTTKEWLITDFFTQSDNTRILDNLTQIKNAYYTYSTTPQVPTYPINTAIKFNNIEKIIDDIWNLYKINADEFYYMDEIYCGEDIGDM
jgi:hypothetical protein